MIFLTLKLAWSEIMIIFTLWFVVWISSLHQAALLIRWNKSDLQFLRRDIKIVYCIRYVDQKLLSLLWTESEHLSLLGVHLKKSLCRFELTKKLDLSSRQRPFFRHWTKSVNSYDCDWSLRLWDKNVFLCSVLCPHYFSISMANKSHRCDDLFILFLKYIVPFPLWPEPVVKVPIVSVVPLLAKKARGSRVNTLFQACIIICSETPHLERYNFCQRTKLSFTILRNLLKCTDDIHCKTKPVSFTRPN